MERKPKITRREFEGNVKISITDQEVRIWICKEGVSVFRIKAMGKVYSDKTDVVVLNK